MSSQRLYPFIAVLGLVGIVWLSYTADSYVQQQHMKETEASFKKTKILLEDEFESITHGLQGLSGVYTVLKYDARASDIHRYAESRNSFENFKSVLGFGFIRLVKTKELHRFEQKRRQSTPDFTIKNLDPDALTKYSDQMIIEQIEPLAGNLPALGLNVGSEENRRHAIIKATETGTHTVTAPIQLVQKSKKEPGFLLFYPVYATRITPKSLEARRSQIIGWSYAPILANQLISSLSSKIDAKLDFAIEVQRESGEFENIYDPAHILSQHLHHQNEHTHWISEEITIANRKWKLSAILKEFYGFDLVTIFIIVLSLIISLVWILAVLKIRNLSLTAQTSESKAKEGETWRSAILNGSNYSIISTLPDGTISTFNRAAELMLGYEAIELIGKQTPALIHDPNEVVEYSGKISKELGRTIEPGFETFVAKAAQGDPDTNEWTYIRKDGTKFPVRLSVSALRGEGDHIIGYLGVAEDISELRDAQQKMIYSSKMVSLGEMAGGIAHEINNPLAIIMGKASQIKAHLDSKDFNLEKIKADLTKIEITVARISKIITGLRAFARGNEGDRKEKAQIDEIIHDTLELCKERFYNVGIDLHLELKSQATIYCSPTQISQVLINLLSNSYDATHILSEKWVKIETRSSVDKLQILITDSGQKLSREVQNKIMQPFFTTKPVGKGTGLGLSISKGIIEDHGGTLTYNADSEHTQFIIELPIDKSKTL